MNNINYFKHNWLTTKINNRSFCVLKKYIHGFVVDLGCGDSPYKQEIQTIADYYLGVDWNDRGGKESRAMVFADFSKPLPFRDCFADTVLVFQVMEHIPESSFFLDECFRILKNGNHILITVPFMWHVHEEPHDYYRFTRYALDYLLAKTGFKDIQIDEVTGFWQMMVLKFNYYTARFARGPLKYVFVPLWLFGQMLSPVLDKYDSFKKETGGYVVVAKKP
jgi:SAM-dependent methyltransferase